EHLQECPACAQAHQSLQALRAVIRSETCYYQPPAELQARIRSAVRSASRGGPASGSHRLGWLAVAAFLGLVVIARWGMVRFFLTRSDAPVLTEELLASHVRSQMLPGHLIDVESSDQHTVKPWFDGKLDFSPEVPDLAGHGFALVGGRLDYLDRRPV